MIRYWAIDVDRIRLRLVNIILFRLYPVHYVLYQVVQDATGWGNVNIYRTQGIFFKLCNTNH